MTGTVDSVTTVWIRSAPPRGMSRSTRPRAVIRARTAPWPPSRRPTASAGRPWRSSEARSTATVARLVSAAALPPRRMTALPDFRPRPGGVDGDVGAGLVDHADDAHRDAHLADLQAVGEGGAAHDLADRVGQGGDVAQRLGDGGDARGVEAQAVLEAVRHAVLAAAGEVALVGRDDVVGGGLEVVGEGAQRGVLLGARHQGEPARGGASRLSELADPLDVGGVDPGGAVSHASKGMPGGGGAPGPPTARVRGGGRGEACGRSEAGVGVGRGAPGAGAGEERAALGRGGRGEARGLSGVGASATPARHASRALGWRHSGAPRRGRGRTLFARYRCTPPAGNSVAPNRRALSCTLTAPVRRTPSACWSDARHQCATQMRPAWRYSDARPQRAFDIGRDRDLRARAKCLPTTRPATVRTAPPATRRRTTPVPQPDPPPATAAPRVRGWAGDDDPVHPVLGGLRPRRQLRRRLPAAAAGRRGVAGAHRALLEPHRLRRLARSR